MVYECGKYFELWSYNRQTNTMRQMLRADDPLLVYSWKSKLETCSYDDLFRCMYALELKSGNPVSPISPWKRYHRIERGIARRAEEYTMAQSAHNLEGEFQHD